jgi:glycosyltransferase involved in cell wall biosynthesis
MTTPAISVVMAVYNGGTFLKEAVESILGQTRTDFEFIIINDGSTDGSGEVVESYGDPRIRLINASHVGLVKALNLGLSVSQGGYIARMDADDIARPERLAVQAEYLDAHPNIGVLCSDIATIDADGRTTGFQRQPGLTAELLRDGLLYRRLIKPVIHPTIMMRREVPVQLGGYRAFDSAEDHDFWLRTVDHFGFARLEEIVLDYRIHPGGVSREKGSRQATASAMSAVDYLVRGATGVDLFADRPDLFHSTSQNLRRRLETEVLIPATAFRDGRLRMLTGNQLVGWTMVIGALLRYGPDALPRSASRRIRRIIDDAVQSVSHMLAEKVA